MWCSSCQTERENPSNEDEDSRWPVYIWRGSGLWNGSEPTAVIRHVVESCGHCRVDTVDETPSEKDQQD